MGPRHRPRTQCRRASRTSRRCLPRAYGEDDQRALGANAPPRAPVSVTPARPEPGHHGPSQWIIWCSDGARTFANQSAPDARFRYADTTATLARPTFWTPQQSAAWTSRYVSPLFRTDPQQIGTPPPTATQRKRIWSEPTTDQKVGGSNPFGRASNQGRN